MVTPPPAGLILALDQGGHASRALVFDARGNEVAAAHVPVDTRHEGEDRVEHDADQLVKSLQLAVRDACDSESLRGQAITVAGLATQRSTVVCWEKSSGRPLADAISWQDRRNAAWLERLRPHEAEVRALTGLVLSPHYGASKLRWCLDHVRRGEEKARRTIAKAGLVFCSVDADAEIARNRLRRKLEDSGVSITTVRGSGTPPGAAAWSRRILSYRRCPPVSEV